MKIVVRPSPFSPQVQNELNRPKQLLFTVFINFGPAWGTAKALLSPGVLFIFQSLRKGTY